MKINFKIIKEQTNRENTQIPIFVLEPNFDDHVKSLNKSGKAAGSAITNQKITPPEDLDRTGLTTRDDQNKPIVDPNLEKDLQDFNMPKRVEGYQRKIELIEVFPSDDNDNPSPAALDSYKNVKYIFYKYTNSQNNSVLLGAIFNDTKKGGYVTVPASKFNNFIFVDSDKDELKPGNENSKNFQTIKNILVKKTSDQDFQYNLTFKSALGDVFMSSGFNPPETNKDPLKKPNDFKELEQKEIKPATIDIERIKEANKAKEKYSGHKLTRLGREFMATGVKKGDTNYTETISKINKQYNEDVASLAAMIMTETGGGVAFGPYAVSAVALVRKQRGWYNTINEVVKTRNRSKTGKTWNNGANYDKKFDNFYKIFETLILEGNNHYRATKGKDDATRKKAERTEPKIQKKIKDFRLLSKNKKSKKLELETKSLSDRYVQKLRNVLVIASDCLSRPDQIMSAYSYSTHFIHPSGMPKEEKDRSIFKYDFENEKLYVDNEKKQSTTSQDIKIRGNPKYGYSSKQSQSGGVRYVPKWVVNHILAGKAYFPKKRNILLFFK